MKSSGPVTPALTRAAAAGHDVVLVQVVSPDEIEPNFEGDWALEDAETGEVIEVTMDAAAIEAYVLRFAGLCEELRETWNFEMGDHAPPAGWGS